MRNNFDSNSAEHAVIQLISQILDAFNENKYTLGIFIDLSKAFDTVDHNILLKKLDMYGIKGKNLKWFHSYLTNRKQFIKCRDQNTDLEVLRCGVPQGSILGPLLFLIFVNDLKNSTKLLDLIMFADDTPFFHKPSACDSIPLSLPTITFNNIKIKRESSVKFLGVITDENITWNKHIELVENKISKNIGILYRASHYLDKKSLKSIYFSFIHNYVNYCNIAWAITSRTKLKNFEEIKACCA